jgi:glutathione S-transferase
MTQPMILHHYDNSPYAEKIRLMFGLADAHWQSLLSPPWPPRPSLDPLAGGYRRIPVAQIGADIFCDTALIAREVAAATGRPELDPANIDGNALALMQSAEKEVFFSAIVAVPPLRLLGTMLGLLGPIGAYRFVKDRSGLLRGGTTRPPEPAAARAALESFLASLATALADNDWVDGAAPSVADFAAYHPLWLHVKTNRKPLDADPAVLRWYARVAAIGHGQREEIDQAQAFSAARDAEPRPLPNSIEQAPVAPRETVAVAPEDYGTVPVTGTLAAVTEDRIVITRETDDFGTLHVHFPRAGYVLSTNG